MTTNIELVASFTNDKDMGAPTNFIETNVQAVVEYLEADPRHAVVIQEHLQLQDEGKLALQLQCQTAVWRGASEELNNFYTQELPLEEPDADGGDLTVDEAIQLAIK